MKAILKTPRIQRSILAILVFVALTIVFFVRLVSQNSADTKATDFTVNNTYEIIKHVGNIKATVSQSEATIRGHLLTGDPRWKTSLTDIQAEMLAAFHAANALVIDTVQKRRMQELENLLQQKIQQQNSIAQSDSVNKTAKETPAFNGDIPVLKSTIDYSIDRFMDRQNDLLAQRLRSSSDAKNKALATAIVGAAVIFIFILVTMLQLSAVINRRNKAEADIRNSESKYRQLIEDAGVTMFTCDMYGTFTYVSGRCQHLTGYSVAELMGKNFSVLVTPDHLQRVTNTYAQQAMERQTESTTEFPIINKFGELIWVEQEAVLLYDEQGKHYGYQCVVKDITAKKEAEVRIKAADQKIRAMLSSTQEGFYMINPDHTVIMVNEAGQNNLKMTTGWKCQPGDDILDFISDSRRKEMTTLFDRVMKGYNEETESQAITARGEKWFHTSYFPVRDEKDTVIAVCASSKDVTERKLAERAIEKVRIEREEYQFRLQSILDNTPAIIFVKDLQGRYLIINKSFRDTFGLADAQVIGKTDFEFDTSGEAARYRKVDEEVIRTLQSVEAEETRVSEHGIQNLLLVKFPLFDKDNTIYGVGGIATDFTDKVQYRQKLIEAKKKAESAEQLQEQFLANMSHEIRTPMNGIIGMSNILSGTSLNNEQKEFVDIIRQSSKNLLFLINDILDLSKIKAGKLSLERTRFRLREVLDNTLAPFYPKAKEKNIELLLSHDPAIPAEMEGDPYRLNQVLNNLLSNALKFTEKGSIRLFVRQVKQTAAITELEFSVTDTGVGIATDKLESIFNSFEQANDSITRKYGGTGLGLAITRKLVEIQDGTIGVNSQPGKGTTFYFRISYALAKGEALGIMISADEQPINAGLAGKKILVAEDNEINQKVIWHVLTKEGIEVTIANHGGEAVALLEKGNVYDLVILDLRMPEMDGFQAATYIRQKLQLNMPIIAMTANALRNEREKCYETGMNEYLTKPFVPADLFVQLRRFLLEQPITTSTETVNEPIKTTNEMYDLSYLHQMEDNEYTCEMLELFLDTTPPMLAELKEAVFNEHWEQVNANAHKLKSNLNLLKINRMIELVQAIEFQAKKQQDTDKIPMQLKQAAEQFELIRPMIEAELTSSRLKKAS